MSSSTTVTSTTFSSGSTASAVLATVANAYAYAVSQLAAWMRPRTESPAETALRLRTMAELYVDHQPSFAADLRAVADRYDDHHG